MSLFRRISKIISSQIGDFKAHGSAASNEARPPYGTSESSYYGTEGQQKSKHQEAATDKETMGPESEFYANLEVEPGSDLQTIRASYRRLMKQYHPDKHQVNPEKAETARLISAKLNDAMEHFEKKLKPKN